MDLSIVKIALIILGLLMLATLIGIAITGCGELFPKCGPGSHCAPVEPNYPAARPPAPATMDAGTSDARP